MPELNKILIIDDEMMVRQVTTICLKQMGIQVVTAKDGTEGLEKAREEKPDLILLDYMMPDLDGIQVANEIKKDPEISKIPIVMMSGKAESVDIKNAEEIGIQHYLQKPISPKFIQNFLNENFLD